MLRTTTFLYRGIIERLLDIRTIPVSQMKPAKYNPRKDLKPGDAAYEKIKRSLTDFDYVDPIIWNEVTGNIVGGHQRYKVLTAVNGKLYLSHF